MWRPEAEECRPSRYLLPSAVAHEIAAELETARLKCGGKRYSAAA